MTTGIITAANSGLSSQALHQQTAKRRLVRLFHGAYINAEAYDAMDASERYRACAQAFLATHPRLHAWGITAASLNGAPVLSGSPLHFAGSRHNAKTRQEGCVFHDSLPAVPAIDNPAAQMIFECVVSSPLPEALLAANHILRHMASKAIGGQIAQRLVDGSTTVAFVREPLDAKGAQVRAGGSVGVGKLDVASPGFLRAFSAARITRFASSEAELLWLDFAELCVAYSSRRAIPRALQAGLYLSDQMESPAETLLVARCVELGFAVPHLQVTILDPAGGRTLGRVDGLWASPDVMRGMYLKDGKHGRLLYCRRRGDSESLVIEFDGRLKYQSDYADSLEKERLRQNSINNLGFRFLRVGWDDLMQPRHLQAMLMAAKVPRTKRI